MTAKKVAILFGAFLACLGAIDFLNRLMVTSVSDGRQNGSFEQGVGNMAPNRLMLDEAAVKELLSWSDIKLPPPKVLPAPVQQLPVEVEEPKAPEPSKIVASAILGDPSQYLLDNDLLALKGIFYDGKYLASVEIQNIYNKKIRYITFTKGKGVDKTTGKNVTDYRLVEVGKYHLVLKKQETVVKLKLFK